MNIQQKLVVIPLTVMLLVSSVGMLLVERYLESHLLERNATELTTLAKASLESIKTLESVEAEDQEYIIRAFQRLAENIAHAGDFRITYIDANGKVLGDSDISFEQLTHIENYADRSEIEFALKSGIGVSERFSVALSEDMLYVAVRSGEAHYTDRNSHLEHPIVARVARSQSSIQTAINELRETLLLTGVLSFIAVLILSLLGARTMNKSVQNERLLLEKRVVDRTTEISILQTFGGLLNACSTMAEAGQVMNVIIPKLLPEFKGSISIIKSSRNRLDTIATWGGEWIGADHFAPNECWALRKGHQHLSTDHGIQIACQHWSEEPIEQTLCIPLLAQGETIGVLHFVMPQSVDFEQNQAMAHAIAEQIGLTLANIQLRDNLREQAIRDPLTGLFNRRYMTEALDQSHSRAERTGTHIAIMMIDLDHFKLFNDNFGHDAGDHVLKAVSQVLIDSLRREDIACRYGGEEFCIVCPSTDEQQCLQIAERIGQGIRSLELNMNELSLGTVTTSIGIAIYPNHAKTMDEVISIADDALYLAKKNGRDRVEIAQINDSEKVKEATNLVNESI